MNTSTGISLKMFNLEPRLPLDDEQFQTSVSGYVFVACTGILIWDVLENVKDDYTLLFNYRIRLPTIAYFISRFSSLAYILLSTVFQTTRIIYCTRFQKAMGAMYSVAVPSTTLLFTIRVRAIYGGSKSVTAFFGILWLFVIGGCLTTIHGDTVREIGKTGYCVNTHFEGYATSSVIAPLINDTLVFLAISWRLMQATLLRDGHNVHFQEIVLGRRMPPFSRALFNDGQMYYLTTITTNLSTLIMMFMTSLPDEYRIMLAGPNVMLMNIMACRVFRNTKFAPLSYCTQQTMISAPPASSESMDIRSTQMPSFASNKLYAHGDTFSGTFSITVDISTGEHGTEHAATAAAAERPKIHPGGLDNAEKGQESC